MKILTILFILIGVLGCQGPKEQLVINYDFFAKLPIVCNEKKCWDEIDNPTIPPKTHCREYPETERCEEAL